MLTGFQTPKLIVASGLSKKIFVNTVSYKNDNKISAMIPTRMKGLTSSHFIFFFSTTYQTIFEETPTMSTYLLAFIITADFKNFTNSNLTADYDFSVFARPTAGKLSHCNNCTAFDIKI